MPQFSPNSDTITIKIAHEGTGSVVTFTQAGVDIADELRQLPAGAKGQSEQSWEQGFSSLAALFEMPAQPTRGSSTPGEEMSWINSSADMYRS